MTDKADTILDGLSKDEWIAIYRDLVRYGEYLLRIYGIKYDTQGINANDFVGRVVMKVLDVDADDHRVWNPKKNPDVVKFFKGCISSEISNHLVSKRHSTTIDMNIDPELDFFENIGTDTSIISEVDANIIQEKIINKLMEEDVELVEVLFLIQEDISFQDIAKRRSYPNTRKVYYARDKIRSISDEVLNKLSEEKDE
ncbi:MAG: hypothetical protein JJ895_12135 [Balneolaceae bacterium]|nr:hypothetical protein [Balneolaceae bacterium]